MTSPTVFLSYARKDLADARALHDRLEAAGVTVWWDQEELPGEDWLEQLMAWLERADAVIVLVSRHSVTSCSVKNEVLQAQHDGRPVLPVVLEDARGGLWLLIRSLQWVDARESRDPLPDLLRVLHRRPSTRARTDGQGAAMVQSSPPVAGRARAQVTIILPGDVADFGDREQHSLVQLLAHFARLRPDQIRIVRVESGSVLVTLELPESSARWLVAAYEQQAPLAELLDIQAVRDLRVLPSAPDAAARQAPQGAAEGRPWHWPRALTQLLAAGLATTLLVVALVTGLRQPAAPAGAPVGYVDAVRGAVDLQRAGWQALAAASPGATIRAGDRLLVASGAEATVRCADGSLVSLPAGGGEPCRASASLFDVGGAQWANTVLSGSDAGVPQLIAPRATALISATPTIRWAPVTGVVTYTVVLRREGEEVWRREVSGAEQLTYPADQSPLVPGPVYVFGVSTGDGREEYAQGSGVQVLDPQRAEAVRAEALRVAALQADDATERLLLANLYARNGLYAEALALLDPGDVAAGRPAQQLLGDLHLVIGLPNLAAPPYTRALEAARRDGDRAGEAQANWMLGTVYSRLGGSDNRASAVRHYQAALRFYEEVGDADAQTELRQLLANLS